MITKLSVLLVIFATYTSRARADISVASGLAPTWNIRQDYGKQNFLRLGYELPTYVYLPVIADLYARTGLRLGYSNAQPEMPGGVKFTETDMSYGLDLGVVYDWYIVPSMSFGYGTINRTIKVKTSSRIDSDGTLNRKERLKYWSMQIGAGIPVLKGWFLFEPFYRHQSIKADKRTTSAVGFEITVQYL